MDNTEELYFSHIDSPVGTLEMVASSKGLREINLFDHTPSSSSTPKKGLIHSTEKTQIFAIQLKEYFLGTRTVFDFQLDLSGNGTPFQKKCWEALTRIPFGSTQSYLDIAKSIGKPLAVRAVGNANGKNPLPIVMPCHRVIAHDGKLGGFSLGLKVKQFLLEHERKICSKSIGDGSKQESKRSLHEDVPLKRKKRKLDRVLS